jgi:hypothetical protein
MKNKIKSFTLAELLVVIIITAVIVGLAFLILGIVRKEIKGIEDNFNKTAGLLLFEQQLSKDFNKHSSFFYDAPLRMLNMNNDAGTTTYCFTDGFILRNKDTIYLKLHVNGLYHHGNKVQGGSVDAILISGNAEFPNYDIFVSGTEDTTNSMNGNGF